ncbi:sacsin N-terminal ATP-binding-like domain-containing protein, partial [Kitasatospora sp. NPDC059571]|uniref:sacsin N-terminal ATP-binding-like domain-containing protein n=1 Tax=Kitasatospora sp. NPDC059571 TaxID=3346871 RepID=UPI0036B6D7FC
MEPRIIGGTDGQAADVFDTAGLRHRVLDAWTAAPARFREDANAEEELALGGYRDRLIVELAQNAADAAARANAAPGRLRLTLRDGVLAAANTGAPLDATAVESLSTLRASAKRADGAPSVGRFGVGFSAVLAVTDEPAVLSSHGSVRWSLAEAHALTADRPQLAEELRRREGHVPLLRLPFPAEGAAPAGYDTVVVLPLRDAAAEDLTRRLLADIDDALLLTLPGLAEIAVETPDGVRTLTRGADEQRPDGITGVTITDGTTQTLWQTVTAGGTVAPELLADRTTEERARPWWSVTWAVPVSDTGVPQALGTTPVVHAPTPSDEPLGVPALLIAGYPLDSTRRHVAPGPLTDFLTERAADAYADLLRARGADLGSLSLVPGRLGHGTLDNALRAAILDRLPGTPFLPHPGPVEDGTPALRPRDATLLEGADTS